MGFANGLASFTGCLPDDGFQSAILRARSPRVRRRRAWGADAARARAPVPGARLACARAPLNCCRSPPFACDLRRAEREGDAVVAVGTALRPASAKKQRLRSTSARRLAGDADAMAPAPDYDAEKGAASARAAAPRVCSRASAPARKQLGTAFAHAATASPRRRCAEKCRTFLANFASVYDADGGLKYVDMLVRRRRWAAFARFLYLFASESPETPLRLSAARAQQEIANRRRRALDIEMDDIASVRAAASRCAVACLPRIPRCLLF
jgi:hypothetical protein